MKTEVRQTADRSVDKLTKEFKDKINLFDVIGDVAGKAWNVGEDIVDAYYAGVDSLSGEDGMSLLAQEVVTAKELSLPLTMPIRECNPAAITDANKMSVAQVWSLVSKMKQAIAYDASGTNAYYNVDLQGRDQRKNTDFMKLLNGGKIFRYSVVHLFTQTGYITYDYQNVYGNQGLLTLDEALVIRNATVEWKNELNEGWKDEWLMLPGIAK